MRVLLTVATLFLLSVSSLAMQSRELTVRGYAQIGGCTSWEALRSPLRDELEHEAAADAQLNANTICQKFNGSLTGAISNAIIGQGYCSHEQGVEITNLEIIAYYSCVPYFPPQPCKKCGDICCNGY